MNRYCVSRLLTHPFLMKGLKLNKLALFDGISEIMKELSQTVEMPSVVNFKTGDSFKAIDRSHGPDTAFNNICHRDNYSKGQYINTELREVNDYNMISNSVASPPLSDKFIAERTKEPKDGTKRNRKIFDDIRIDILSHSHVGRNFKKTKLINFDSESNIYG